DTIGSKRSMHNDVGEIRRVLNTFLQLLDEHHSDSLIISATNHKEILDSALYRRFDDVIEYSLPEKDNLIELIKSKYHSFELNVKEWGSLLSSAEGLSYSEVSKSCDDAIKFAIINNLKKIDQTDLQKVLEERKAYK
ncbi:AAA family ATPase, partial [Salmonella enterica subsp. enterica serovar Schwarzengrund]|nr:AAA family ATPase [Salmonella enterica subsp. enterica serovar Schwarzengrund]